MKRMLIVSLLCLIISSCTNQEVVSIATPELTTDHISGWIVYSKTVSREPVKVEIFLKNLDTSEVTQLTDSGHNRAPKWSPDGSKIAFVSLAQDSREDIYTMNKDGSNQTVIVATFADEITPDWSSNGKQIVYSSYTRDSASEIYLIDIATKNVEKLTDSTEWDYSPSWSVDRKQIAFTFGMVDSRTQIYTMNNDGSDIKQITNDKSGHFNHSPVWCPDDNCIVFGGGEGGSELLLFDLNNQTVSPLLGNVFEPDLTQSSPERSPIRGYISFIVGDMSYAMDMKTKKIYSLGVPDALDISLYP